jgi:hypothetical protein
MYSGAIDRKKKGEYLELPHEDVAEGIGVSGKDQVRKN